MAPIVVKLSGHVQTNDRLAIREMGRQIAVAEGVKPVEEEGNEEEAAEGDAEVRLRPLWMPSADTIGIRTYDTAVSFTGSPHCSITPGYHYRY
jgi:hypothetical protein